MHSIKKHFCEELYKLGLDIYSINLDEFSGEEVVPWYKILDEEEKARAGQFISSVHRRRYIIAHAGLRYVLGQHLNVPANEIVFGQKYQQKPIIANPFTQIEFNLSHSEGLAMVVVGANDFLGIDVEKIRDLSDVENILESCLSEREQKIVNERTSFQTLTIWTLKEAVVKATGDGLFRSLSSIEFDAFPPSRIRLSAFDGQKPTEEWRIASFQPHSDYIASIAAA